MNYRQRAYDSYDRSNYNLKVTNSYYHFKNIQKILFRKPEYKTIKKTTNSPKFNISSRPFRNYFVLRQNELYKKVLNDIKTTKIKPKINAYHKMKEEKLRDYRRQSKTLENRELARENTSFQKRLKNQKSMLRIRDMDRNYKINQLKILDKSKKIRALRNIVFPPISTIVNRMHSPKLIKKFTSHDNKSYRTPASKDGVSYLNSETNF